MKTAIKTTLLAITALTITPLAHADIPASVAMITQCQKAPKVTSPHWSSMLLVAEKDLPLTGTRVENRNKLIKFLGVHGGAADLGKQSAAFRATFDSISLYTMNNDIIAAQMMYMSNKDDPAFKASQAGRSLTTFLTAATDVPDHYHSEDIYNEMHKSEQATATGTKLLGDLRRFGLASWSVRATAWSDPLATHAAVIGLCNDQHLTDADRKRIAGVLGQVMKQVH